MKKFLIILFLICVASPATSAGLRQILDGLKPTPVQPLPQPKQPAPQPPKPPTGK